VIKAGTEIRCKCGKVLFTFKADMDSRTLRRDAPKYLDPEPKGTDSVMWPCPVCGHKTNILYWIQERIGKSC